MYVPPDTWRHQVRLKKQGYKQIAISLAASIYPQMLGT